MVKRTTANRKRKQRRRGAQKSPKTSVREHEACAFNEKRALRHARRYTDSKRRRRQKTRSASPSSGKKLTQNRPKSKNFSYPRGGMHIAG